MSPVDAAQLERAGQRFADLDHVPIGMAVLDAALHVLYWNRTLEAWTGIRREAAVGKSIVDVNPVWANPHYAGRLAHLFTGGPPVVFSPLLHPKIIPARDDEAQTFHVKASAVPGEPGWWVILSVEDVSVLSRRVEELRTLHGQQDRMMREIHHRVKNNMNMISGLISMQKAQPGTEAAHGSLNDLQSRIVALSELHDLLYHSASLSIESAADYLDSVAHLLNKNLSLTQQHSLELNFDRSIVLKTDTTVLLGLIQAELMTNALKYGLGHQSGEKLTVRLARVGAQEYEYELSHTGDRLPDAFRPETASGLGMVLLTAYAGQLGTVLRWAKGDPTRFWVRFTER